MFPNMRRLIISAFFTWQLLLVSLNDNNNNVTITARGNNNSIYGVPTMGQAF